MVVGTSVFHVVTLLTPHLHAHVWPQSTRFRTPCAVGQAALELFPSSIPEWTSVAVSQNSDAKDLHWGHRARGLKV